MSSIVPNLSLQASLRSLLTASSSPSAPATPALTQDRAFTAFSSAILGALGASSSAGDSANGRVGDVALALKNALENPGASGDVVGSLLNSVQAALGQASKALGELSPEQVMKRIKKLEAEMMKLARNLEFEAAAKIRDEISELRNAGLGLTGRRAG